MNLPLLDQTLALIKTMPDKSMCLSISLTFFCLLLSLYLGLQKPNGMWVNLCAVLLNIFVIFFSCVFVIVVAFVLYLLSWPQEPTGVWVSVLIGDQAVFHKEVFTDSYVCVYIYRYRYICVCQCEDYIFMFVFVLVFGCVFVLDFKFAFFSLYIYIWVILRCWGNSSMVCQQNSDAL